MHTHHDEHTGSGEPAAAASWFVAMALTLVLAVALIIALFAWAPWDDDATGPVNEGGNAPAEQQQGGDADAEGGEGGIDIEGDIDVNPDGGEEAPQQ
jgi:hypothetical protein